MATNFQRSSSAGRKRVGLWACIGLLAVVGTIFHSPSWGHEVSSALIFAQFDTEERTYLIDVAMEVAPSDDDALNAEITPEEAAESFVRDYLTVMFDEQDQSPALTVIRESISDENTPPELRREQVTVKLADAIPEGAREFLLYLDPASPMAIVLVVKRDERSSRRKQVILAGEFSRPVDVGRIEVGDPFALSEKEGGAAADRTALADREEKAAEGSSSTSWRYLAVGWKGFLAGSLLPAFVVICLFLPTLRRRPVIVQLGILFVTSALGASFALGDVISIPLWTDRMLGVLLAVLAVEGLLQRDCRWWRLGLLTVAGFFVGMAVVSIQTESLGVLATLAVVLGLDLAIFVVAGIAAVVLLSLSRFDWYRSAVIQPLAVLLCGYGIFTLIEPVFGL